MQEHQKDSKTFELGKPNIPIGQFYDELRQVKAVESAAFNNNFKRAKELKTKLTIPLYQDMADTWIKKNEITQSRITS